MVYHVPEDPMLKKLTSFRCRDEYDIGRLYEDVCERFDADICKFRNDRGVAIPFGEEVRKCTANAHEVRRALCSMYGVTWSQLLGAINMVQQSGYRPELHLDEPLNPMERTR